MKIEIPIDEFRKNTLIIFLLSTLASAINYLCQIIMGHALSINSFGIVNTIFSFVLIFGFPGTTFYMLATKFVAENDSKERILGIFFTLCRYLFFASLLIFVLSYLFQRSLATLIGTTNFVILLFSLLILSASYLQQIYLGVLSGMKLFLYVGLFTLVFPVFKLLGVFISNLLVSEDAKIVLILLFMILGYIASSIMSYFYLRKRAINPKISNVFKRIDINLGKISVFTFVSNFIFIVFSNLDIVSINSMFGSKETGLYSSVMFFGRIVFYFITALVTVMLPVVSSENANNGKPEAIFGKIILYSLVISIICYLPLNVAPDFFVNLIYGQKYIEATKYVPYVTIYSVLISILNVILNYLIGIGKIKKLFISLIIGLGVSLAMLIFFINSIQDLLLSISFVIALLIVFNIRDCIFIRKKDCFL